MVIEKLNAVEDDMKQNKPVHGLLALLLASEKLSIDEVCANAIDLMTGAVDTVRQGKGKKAFLL